MKALALALVLGVLGLVSAQAFDPPGQWQGYVNASSGDVANATAAASLPAVANTTNVLTGVEVTAGGATAGVCVVFTISGLAVGNMSYDFCAPTGAAVGAAPLILQFPNPLMATGSNVAITASLPALGTGALHAAVSIHGYQVK